MPRNGLASDDPMPPRPVDGWVFDVDGCLIDSLTGSSLRPGARDILEHLAAEGRHIVFWSAGGDTYARTRAQEFGVDQLVDDFCSKESRDAGGFYRTTHLPLPHCRAVFIDDRPEDLAPDLDVLAVSPYLSDDPFDRGLKNVAHRAGLEWPDPPPGI
jgi:long-chain acyl-CoA synthetase